MQWLQRGVSVVALRSSCHRPEGLRDLGELYPPRSRRLAVCPRCQPLRCLGPDSHIGRQHRLVRTDLRQMCAAEVCLAYIPRGALSGAACEPWRRQKMVSVEYVVLCSCGLVDRLSCALRLCLGAKWRNTWLLGSLELAQPDVMFLPPGGIFRPAAPAPHQRTPSTAP